MSSPGALRDAIIFGFDSAWTDSAKAPGAICAMAFDGESRATFHPPELVSFAGALDWIAARRPGHSFSLVALDQPTIVPNTTSNRPVEKVAASAVSFAGGGVQPANRGRRGMFDDAAPIWGFLTRLGATQDPCTAHNAREGHHLIEVFPALALLSLNPAFAARLGAPKYNPKSRAKFRLTDWQRVSETLQRWATELGLPALADYAREAAQLPAPSKSDQDRLDAALCLLVGLLWRPGSHAEVAMIGDLKTGYMITPLSEPARTRLEQAAAKRGVAMRPPSPATHPRIALSGPNQ